MTNQTVAKNMLLHNFENKYVIKGKLKTLTSLHIGNGKHTYSPQDADNMVIRNASTNQPFIPGSSIKGVLRAYLEMLLPSLEVYGQTCIVTDKPCLDQKKDKEIIKQIKKQYKDNPEAMANAFYNKLCPICRLFGSQVMSSKIQIKDAQLINKAIIETRDGVGINRDTGTAANRVKYDFECVSMGAEFSFLMTVDNLEPEYETLLKIMINTLTSGELTLGGKKSIGLGEVELIDIEAYKIQKEQLMDYALKGESDEMRWEYV